MKITFGKYRNQELTKVYKDENYKNWLLNQSFFKDKYPEEYKYLLKYKPLSPINFNDLPGDIKSKIFKINKDAEKAVIDDEISNRIHREGNGKYQIIHEENITRNDRVKYTVKKKRWLNCVKCGNQVNDRAYHFCYKCFREWEKKKNLTYDIPKVWMIDSDDE